VASYTTLSVGGAPIKTFALLSIGIGGCPFPGKTAVGARLPTLTPRLTASGLRVLPGDAPHVTYPTYKALAEPGKVENTIYLCEYFSLDVQDLCSST
jgi:hypothetical protein